MGNIHIVITDKLKESDINIETSKILGLLLFQKIMIENNHTII